MTIAKKTTKDQEEPKKKSSARKTSAKKTTGAKKTTAKKGAAKKTATKKVVKKASSKKSSEPADLSTPEKNVFNFSFNSWLSSISSVNTSGLPASV